MKCPQAINLVRPAAAKFVVALIFAASLTNFVSAQRRVSDMRTVSAETTEETLAPNAVLFPSSNTTCADLNAIPDNGPYGTTFNHIVDNNELKLNFGLQNGPINGTFQFRTYTASPYGSVILTGNTPLPLYRTINVVTSGNNIASFNSQVQITAVIIKVANDSYVYPYSGITYSDTNLISRTAQSISHINFCYGVSVAPSAGPAALSGRVFNSNGMGIMGANVTIMDPLTGASMTAKSNGFGYYTFTGVPAGNLYIVSIAHKSYTFNNDTRSVTLNEDFADMDFVANPQ